MKYGNSNILLAVFWLPCQAMKCIPFRDHKNTVQPRLSGPRLSGTSIIRTSQRPKNTLPRMRRRRDWRSFVGVVIDWAMSYGLYRLALAKIDGPKYFSEHCWPWSYCIGIVYRLGIINQARNVGISVIRTFHLSGMAAIGQWTKGSG